MIFSLTVTMFISVERQSKPSRNGKRHSPAIQAHHCGGGPEVYEMYPGTRVTKLFAAFWWVSDVPLANSFVTRVPGPCPAHKRTLNVWNYQGRSGRSSLDHLSRGWSASH